MIKNIFIKRDSKIKNKSLFLFLGPVAIVFLITLIFNSRAFCQDTTPPNISDLKISPYYVNNRWGSSSATVNFKTDEPAKIYYRLFWDEGGSWQEGWSEQFEIEHTLYFNIPIKAISKFYIECTDQAGNKAKTPVYEIVNYPYLRGYININNSALITNSRNVTLTLQAFDPEFKVTQMSFSNDGKNWSGWQSYDSIKAWQLSEGEGLKTVYARFKNSKGLYMSFPTSDSIYYTTTQQIPGPSLVQIEGRQLLVKKPNQTKPIPFKIKGVSWSPTSIGNPGGGSLAEREAEFQKWYRQDIALMKEMGINTVRTYLDFGQDFTIFKAILDELYNNDIMVIMAVDDCLADLANLDRVVSNFKNHPAILMWQVGNEWNLNQYYQKFSKFEDAVKFTEDAAQRIKQLDTYHPVASTLGDSEHFIIPALGENWQNRVIEYFTSRACPSVDIWGFNIYRSGSFGGLFYEWNQISAKPMFIAEAGTDVYDTRIHNENQKMQADFDAGLFDENYFHFSADRPSEPCLGITFFEWNDEWWKNYDVWNHNPGGYNMPYSHPDGMSDEEYYGLVDINRGKRQVYFTLGDHYKKQGQLINLASSINLKAVSSGHAQFFKNGQVVYDKQGYGGGGRGLNFAIIDPKTGLVEKVHNFDTWLDNDALLYVTNFINSIPDGKIIMAAIADEGGLDGFLTYRETAYKSLESIGSKLIRDVKYGDTWAMISIKGRSGNLAEGHNSYVQGQGARPVEVEANIALELDLDKDNIADSIDNDRDNDSVTDEQELTNGTDPLDPDTDDDGVRDNLGINHAPELKPIGNKTVKEGQALTFTISAIDPDGDTLSYSATNLPAGASFNASTQAFSWVPNHSQAGTYQVTFTVSDGRLSDSEEITITVKNVNTASPKVGSISPSSGSSNVNQLTYITATYSDADGWEDIQEARMLINTKIDGAKCFYGYYNQNTNKLYVRDDANKLWLGGFTPGSANMIENSYAKLDCSQTTVSGKSATLTVKWAIIFKSAFIGTKNAYLYVKDDAGSYQGWLKKGTWKIINQVPSVGNISPASGSSIAGQVVTFTTTYSDANGWQDIQEARLLINTKIDGAKCFYGYYNQNTHKFYLRNDANAGWLGGYAPGSSNIIKNSYVTLNCAQSSVSGTNSTLTIRWVITFKSAFRGDKNTYLYVKDDSGAYQGWVKKGSWTIK